MPRSLFPSHRAVSALLVAWIGVFSSAATAQGPGGATHAKPGLISEFKTLTPGETAWLGITFDIDPEWHIYWDGQGDTGQPVKAVFTVPAGFEVGELVWLAPKRYVVADFALDYVYEGRVTLLAPLKVPEEAKPGEKVTIAAKLDWMECSEECRPGRATVSLEIPVAATGEEREKTPDATRFEDSRRLLPRSVEETAKIVQTSWKGSTLSIVVPGASRLSFFPHRTSAPLVNAMEQGESASDRLTLDIDGVAADSDRRVVGILEVTRSAAKGKPRVEYFQVDIPHGVGSDARPTNQNRTHEPLK